MQVLFVDFILILINNRFFISSYQQWINCAVKTFLEEQKWTWNNSRKYCASCFFLVWSLRKLWAWYLERCSSQWVLWAIPSVGWWFSGFSSIWHSHNCLWGWKTCFRWPGLCRSLGHISPVLTKSLDSGTTTNPNWLLLHTYSKSKWVVPEGEHHANIHFFLLMGTLKL